MVNVCKIIVFWLCLDHGLVMVFCHSVCELLVKRTRGKCVYDEEEDSNTALHLAAQNGHRDVVQHLIAHGADKQCR